MSSALAGSLPPNHLVRLAVAAAQLEEPPTKLVGALVAAVSTKARQLHPKAGIVLSWPQLIRDMNRLNRYGIILAPNLCSLSLQPRELRGSQATESVTGPSASSKVLSRDEGGGLPGRTCGKGKCQVVQSITFASYAVPLEPWARLLAYLDHHLSFPTVVCLCSI